MVGYKQTDIGLIPNDWKIDKIFNLSTITTGSKNTQDRINDGNFPFFVRSQTVEKINSYSFDGEAVLTAGDGVGTGKIFHYISGKFDFHQRVYKISHFSNKLNGFYFYLYFRKNFYNRIMQMTAKSSVDSVRMEMIADMLIPLPSLQEQESIAEVLSDTDALISALEKRIAKRRLIKQGAMQTLLTLKDDWEVKKLGEIGKITMGQSPVGTSYTLNKDDIPLINGAVELTPDGIIINKYTNQPTRMSNAGDLLFCIRATIGNLQYSDKKYCLGRGVSALTVALNNDKNFVYYQLIRLFIEMINKSEGGVIKGLRKEDLSNLKFHIPIHLEDQKEIGSVLLDIDNEIKALEKKLSKTKQLKQGLMQQLLTGKIRLI